MRLSTPRTCAVAALAVGLLVSTSASAEGEPTTERLYLSAEGCGATQEPGTLSTTLNPAAGSDGCGAIGGVPLGGVLYELDAATATDYVTKAGDGVPVLLDADRDATGVFATQSWTGGAGAVGDVSVDLVLRGSYRDAANRARSITLGSGTFTQAGSPLSPVTSVPFSFDLADTAGEFTLTTITLSATVHGLNVNGSAQSYNGTSFLDLPTVEAEPEVAEQ